LFAARPTNRLWLKSLSTTLGRAAQSQETAQTDGDVLGSNSKPSKNPFGSFSSHATLGYFGAFVALGMATAILGPTLPALAEQTKRQLSQLGLLFTALSLGYLIGSFQAGRLYDRVPGHPLMAACLIIMAVALATVPLLPSVWYLALCVLILGMAAGTLDVGGNTLLTWLHGRNVGPSMNGLHFAFGLGALLSPIILAQVAQMSSGIAWAYWTLALLLLPVVAWLMRLPSPSTRGESVAEPEAAGSPDQQSAGTGRNILIALIALLLLLCAGAEAAYGGWVFSYAVVQGLSNEVTAAYLTATFWGALTLGRLLGIPIATRVRPRWILLGDLLGCLASVGILLLWPSSPAALWLGTAGLGLCMASVFPTAITLGERRVGITGQTTSWFLVGASLGAMTLPWLIGRLFEPVGPGSTMVVIAVALILAMCVYGGLSVYSGHRLSIPRTWQHHWDQKSRPNS
jgi:FHS family Na+ dependent glucose MFS transporter 1